MATQNSKLSQRFRTHLIPVLLSGAVLLGAGSMLPGAIAQACRAANPDTPVASDPNPGRPLPDALGDRLRRDLAERLAVSPDSLQIASAERQQFSDSCLGLGNIDELCAAVITEGWRAEVTDGEQSWFYRTDLDGTVIRHERSVDLGGFPQSVGDRVVEAAATESGIPAYRLTVMQAESRVWNGCLGIEPPGTVCTEIAINGWRVVVAGEDETLVYHTNSDGSDIRLASMSGMDG